MKIKDNKKNPDKQETIQVEFTANEITNYSGIKPLCDFAKKLNLPTAIEQRLNLHERHNTQTKTADILMTIILAILAGANRVYKTEMFSQDPLVKKLLGLNTKISDNVIHYRLDKFSMKNTSELMEINGLMSNKIHRVLKTKVDIVDLDSSTRTVYGYQEGAVKGYNPNDKGRKSFHPLFGFLNSTKEILLAHLRPGNSYTSNNGKEFLKELFAMLPKKLKTFLLRADSGFFSDDIIKVAEQNDKAKYLIKVKLKNLKQLLETQAWETIKTQEDIEGCSFEHQCAGWEKPRVFSAVRKLIRVNDEEVLIPTKDYEYFCYVSNIDETPYFLHTTYGFRGECENWIEAVKNQLFACMMVKESFWATEALFQCSVMAYNLSVWFRKLTDAKTWKEEPATFRSWFIQLAGKIVKSGRKIYLKLYKCYWHKKRWLHIFKNLDQLVFT